MRNFIYSFLLMMLAIFVGAPAFAQAKTLSAEEEVLLDKNLQGIIRGFIWGIPPTVILENEKGTFVGEEDGSLFYLDYIRGIKCTIAYGFTDNKLSHARIFLEKNYPDPQQRIRDLLLIQEDMTKRFGAPVKEEFKWLDKTEQGWPEQWGRAVYRGELFITIGWQAEGTYIEAKVGAPKKLDPETSIIYESLEYSPNYTEPQKPPKLFETP